MWLPSKLASHARSTPSRPAIRAAQLVSCLIVVAACCVWTGRAQACSCGSGAELFWPEDGAVDVPIEPDLVVTLSRNDDEVILHDPDGVEVPLIERPSEQPL